MPRSATTLVISFVVALFVFSCIYMGGRDWGGSLDASALQSRETISEDGISSKHGVVLLTGLTFEKLQDFEGVQDFYGKIWNNRISYAQVHGNSFE